MTNQVREATQADRAGIHRLLRELHGDAADAVSWNVYQDQVGLSSYNMLPHFKQFQDATPGAPLYDKGMKVSSLGQFEYDALHDKLPTVSWLMTAGGVSEHPKEMPAAGADFVASKIAAIAANISQWRRKTFGDLTSVFRHDHVSKPPALPETGARLNLATYEAAQLPAPTFPTSTQVVPHQERGGRHRL